MQGRDIGSRGDYQATGYIADVFHHLGLEPAGEHGTYFQDLPYGAFTLQGGAPRLTVGQKTLTAGARWIPLAPEWPSSPVALLADGWPIIYTSLRRTRCHAGAVSLPAC